ncbi:unnamed protein product, partial [Closterium sp. Naga37s-1]
SVDVVDVLPGPIWHIIFRLLLLPPANSSQLQKRGDSCEKSPSPAAYSNLCDLVDQLPARDTDSLQNGAGSTSCAPSCPLSASEQHEENARRFGSSWPLLRCAMASKRLFELVTSFS